MNVEDFQVIFTKLKDAIAFVQGDTSKDSIAAGQPVPAKAGIKTICAKTKPS